MDDVIDEEQVLKNAEITAWALRFLDNTTAKRRGKNVQVQWQRKRSGEDPLDRESAKEHSRIPTNLRIWTNERRRDRNSQVQKQDTRLPTYVDRRSFVRGEADPTHARANSAFRNCEHYGCYKTRMVDAKLRSKVKTIISTCTCKVYRAKPYRPTNTAAMPSFRTEEGRAFQTTGVDFAGPLSYKVCRKELGKCYILIFTCTSTRAVHL